MAVLTVRPCGQGSSVELPAPRMVVAMRSSFAELIAEPRPKVRVFDLLKSQPNRLAKKLSDALLGRALGAVMRYARAELR